MIDFENKALILDGIKNGKYNLYLGAGATHSCKNKFNKDFPLGNQLLNILKEKYDKKAPSLYQMAKIIPEEKLNEVLQDNFRCCIISNAIKKIPLFVWRRIFTLNVDNAIECAYDKNNIAKQSLSSVNFTDSFFMENDISTLQLIHLHGMIDKYEDGYVFNASQYIQNIKGNNTWMSVFSDLFQSESFIMSGLSFNEHDVDYYLSFRSKITQKIGNCPSILIEPYPTDYIRTVCNEHGFQLLESTFDDFMQFVSEELPLVPTVYDLKNPKKDVFQSISDVAKYHFFNDFELLQITNNSHEKTPFDYGFEPDMLDICSNKDIRRPITDKIINEILSIKNQNYGSLILLTGKYLNGKTTIALRVLKYLVEKGYIAFRLKSLRGFNVDNALHCLDSIGKVCIVYVDNIADYIHKINDIMLKHKSVIVIGTEREYRIEHIKKVLTNQFSEYNCDLVSSDETDMLVKKYFDMGSVLNPSVLHGNKTLNNFTIGEQVCVILDSYDPINNKIDDFFSYNTNKDDLLALMAVAICCYCYKIGVNYYVIRSILPNKYDFNKLFKIENAFKLEFNKDDEDYVLPRNKLYSRQLVMSYLKTKPKFVQDMYKQIVKNISRSVNRTTVIKNTPESKLLARMIDVDKNVKVFFGKNVDYFMKEIQPYCEWNSRYWEQRALGLVDVDIDTAISYSKQAVAIEYHPYPLTTLEKILFSKMDRALSEEKTYFCIEAIKSCLNAMKEESKRHMESIHPLVSLISGLESYSKNFDCYMLPEDLRKNIYSAVDTYEQEISLSKMEKKKLEKIKDLINS